MARAKRHYIPGQIWHITHRCHKREFLLKFAKDRRRWLQWLYKAKKRYGLTILNYSVTSNHIHLLTADNNDRDTIPESMKLVAGRTGQEYNQRKHRRGAFWEDRYHATAIEKGDHLFRCIVYIDLNMVRAGVVKHPCEWPFCGYNEIQEPKRKNVLINYEKLMDLLGFKDYERLKTSHKKWINEYLTNGKNTKDEKWTQSIAVGDKSFVEKLRTRLGVLAKGRKSAKAGEAYQLREAPAPYGAHLGGKKGDIGLENCYYWDTIPETSMT